MRSRSGAALAVIGAVIGVLAAAPPASAVDAGTAIANLNAQRAANKLPAGVTADPALSLGCANHNSYMNQNGRILTHDEVPGSPGFTTDGQRAAQTSVLAAGTPPWSTPNDNPWETAPIHLAQLLDPSLLVSGYDENFGFACAVTLGGPPRPESGRAQILTYPGPGTKIYGAEIANEGPYTPGELVGIPQPTRTGPYLYIFVEGVDAFSEPRIKRATLLPAKKGKRVKLKRIDGTNPQLGPFIGPGGMLIPVKPLRKGKYKASVTVDAGGQTLKKTWRFSAT
jgi:hypothetical protein